MSLSHVEVRLARRDHNACCEDNPGRIAAVEIRLEFVRVSSGPQSCGATHNKGSSCDSTIDCNLTLMECKADEHGLVLFIT